MAQAEIIVREATPHDRAAVVEIAGRLCAFGPPPWRTPEEVVDGEVRTLQAFFDMPPPDAWLLIAERHGLPLGFAYLEMQVDYFTETPHGHLGIIAVSAEGEGTGAGGALMRAAESWARDKGFAKLTLNVFEGNRRARGVYEHFGFTVETLRYVKILD